MHPSPPVTSRSLKPCIILQLHYPNKWPQYINENAEDGEDIDILKPSLTHNVCQNKKGRQGAHFTMPKTNTRKGSHLHIWNHERTRWQTHPCKTGRRSYHSHKNCFSHWWSVMWATSTRQMHQLGCIGRPQTECSMLGEKPVSRITKKTTSHLPFYK